MKYPLIGYAGFLGVISVLIGSRFDSAKLQSFFIGTGSSLIAAAIYSFVSYKEQELYRKFATLGIRQVFAGRNDVDSPDWCLWLSQVKKHCVLFGIANHNWCEDPRFEGAVRDVVYRKVEIVVFFLSPSSPLTEVRGQEEWRSKGRNTVQIVRDSIRFMWELKQRLDPADREFFRLFIYEGTPSGTNWFDDFMIVTHYLAGTANVNSPALRLESTGGPEDLFSVYKKNIEQVREHCSTEITEANVGDYS